MKFKQHLQESKVGRLSDEIGTIMLQGGSSSSWAARKKIFKQHLKVDPEKIDLEGSELDKLVKQKTKEAEKLLQALNQGR